MLKLTCGSLKGQVIKAPLLNSTRPTSERLRQSLFNVLKSYELKNHNIFSNANVSDLFAGSGALGFEASGLGANSVTFVENQSSAFECIKSNAAKLHLGLEKQKLELPKYYFLKKDVRLAYPKLSKSDVIFCDPPYADFFLKEWIELEKEFERINPRGFFVFETAKKNGDDVKNLETAIKKLGFFVYEHKIYGDSHVSIFIKN